MYTEKYTPVERSISPELSFLGKHFIVAGGTSGVGLETAKQLSKQGASVLVIGSSETTGKLAVERIKRESDNPNTTYEVADLSSLTSTMQLAQRLETTPKIDGFIYCAAPKQDESKMTADGISKDWAVGYFAPNILLEELLGSNRHDSRFSDNAFVGYISSTAFLMGKIDFDKISGRNEQEYASREKAYAGAKRGMVQMMQDRKRRRGNNDPEFTIYDPFVVRTERVRTRARELSTRAINFAIRHVGFSPESTTKHLVNLAQKHFSREPLPFYNIRGTALPELLLPHEPAKEIEKLSQFTQEVVRERLQTSTQSLESGTDKETMDMNGKVCMITGANAGLGFETAKELATLGATVVMVSRSEERGKEATKKIKLETGNQNIVLMVYDLSLQEKVRKLADDFTRTFPRLDVLVNNVGHVSSKRSKTADGIDTTLATNYLNQFLLTNLLLDTLKVTANEHGEARVINTSSKAEQFGDLSIKPSGLKTKGRGLIGKAFNSIARGYAGSKVAQLMWQEEQFAEAQSGVTMNSICPPAIDTKFNSKGEGGILGFFYRTSLGKQISHKLNPEVLVHEVAQTVVRLAASSEYKNISGGVFTYDGKVMEPSKLVDDAQKRHQLVETSRRMIYEKRYRRR